jgi:hypothetical protein
MPSDGGIRHRDFGGGAFGLRRFFLLPGEVSIEGVDNLKALVK